ncbi:MAG: WD40 repeat domain-containing protein, partial [Planctomycetaceae bacterium]
TCEIIIFDTSNGEVARTIPVEEKFSFVDLMGWVNNQTTLLTIDIVLPKEQDFNNRQYQLTFWDVTTGNADTEVKPDDDRLSLRAGKFSPDQKVFAIPSFPGKPGQLSLVDITARTIRKTIEFPESNCVRLPAISPDGQLMAVITQVLPENLREEFFAEDLPQPRIHLIDVQTGNIRETIIAPQAIAIAVAFSPDGKKLASGGQGSVLLWDVSDLSETIR